MLSLIIILFGCETIVGKTSEIEFAPAYDSISPTEYLFYFNENNLYWPHIINCYEPRMIDYTIWKKNTNYAKIWYDICITEYPGELK